MKDVFFLERKDLQRLFDLLEQGGYDLVGPRSDGDVIRLAPVSSPDQLPWGLSDEQESGTYRLIPGPDHRAFAFTTTSQGIKPLVFPPSENLWRVTRTDEDGLTFSETRPSAHPTAVIGVRACDLAGLDLLDRHFLTKGDPWYRTRREKMFLVAVNCSRSSSTCFCHSTGDGPAVSQDYDLLLDELDEGYLIRAGSPGGADLLADTRWESASAKQISAAEEQSDEAASSQKRRLPNPNLAADLTLRTEVAAWDQIGEKCLACGNCTAVCPSCFCHRHHDEPSLDASQSSHRREWDSCFNDNHSLMHGQPHRREIAQRYRQWLSHKLGHWHAQYGRSGCTGCGRCITWCPVGIDITESAIGVVNEDVSA